MRRWIAWTLWLWVVLLIAGWTVSFIRYPSQVLPTGFAGSIFLIVGCFLTIRVSGNLIGPLLFVGASLVLIYDIGTVYAVASIESPSNWPGEYLAAWLGAWTGPISFLTLPVLLAMFPDGRFTGRRKWFLPLFAVVIVATLVGAVGLWGIPAIDLSSVEEGGSLHDIAEYDMFGWIYPATALLSVLAGISLLLRYRKSAAEQRQQIRWLAATVVLVPALGFLAAALLPRYDQVILGLGMSMFPVAVGVAILRYRLYDLGRIVSRTMAYTIVVGLLVFTFAGVSAFLGARISDNPLFVASATLAAASVFAPLRRRIQKVVDQRFNRSKYDAERVVDHFAQSLQTGSDADLVLSGWVGVVTETMQPSSVGVWVRGAG